jgi:ribosomal protein L29
MSSDASVKSVREQLEELVKPLHAQLDSIDKQVKQKQGELAELREARRSISAVLTQLDPEHKKKKDAVSERRKNQASYGRVSAEKREVILAFLREHEEELNVNGGFSAPMVQKMPGFSEISSNATLNWALRAFHDEGTLALVGRGNGGSRLYRFTS